MGCFRGSRFLDHTAVDDCLLNPLTGAIEPQTTAYETLTLFGPESATEVSGSTFNFGVTWTASAAP